MNKRGFIDLDEFNPAALGLALLSVPLFLYIVKYYPSKGVLLRIIGSVISFVVTYLMVTFIADN